MRLKDWVGPWFQAYAGLISQRDGLGGEFDRIGSGETDKDMLLERLLSSVHGYVAGQRSRAGEIVGQKVAERTIRHFMATRLPQLPLDTQLTLMPTLNIAHRNIGAAGMGTLATVSRRPPTSKKRWTAESVKSGSAVRWPTAWRGSNPALATARSTTAPSAGTTSNSRPK